MIANTASSAVTSDLTTAKHSEGYSREAAYSVFNSSIVYFRSFSVLMLQDTNRSDRPTARRCSHRAGKNLGLKKFLANRTISRAFGTMCRLSSVVCDVLYCGETVRPSESV